MRFVEFFTIYEKGTKFYCTTKLLEPSETSFNNNQQQAQPLSPKTQQCQTHPFETENEVFKP